MFNPGSLHHLVNPPIALLVNWQKGVQFVKRFLESRGRLALAVTVLVATSRQALAYLDPGTGSYILQMVLAAVLGGLVALGVFWRRVVLFLKRVLGRTETTGGRDKHVGN